LASFLTELDIANRALQLLRTHRISAFTDHSLEAQELAFAYPKLRDAELRAHVWRFAVRRTPLYAISTTTKVWTPPTWSSSTTYAVGEVVKDSDGNWWQSRVASNTARTPDTDAGYYTAASWQAYFGPEVMEVYAAGDTFFAGDLTYDSAVYLSLTNGNDDDPPSSNWLAVNGTVATLQLLYPIGAGPASDPTTSNVFRLPRGFLRQAPSQPKGAANPYLGAGKGNWREDWVLEGQYLVSASPGPVLMRYVADFVDVTQMEPTFCEMLAARLALEVGPRLPGAAEDYNRLRRHYRDTRLEAIGLNLIETGPIDFDLSDYLAVRLT